MQSKRVLRLLTVYCLATVAMADYDCLCTYDVETNMYDKPSERAAVVGYMYEFDCKPTYQVPGLDSKFGAVGSEHQLVYVLLTTETMIQTCQGDIPDIDKVSLPSVTTQQTTVPPTTTAPTTTTTTQKPTTTLATTPLPTTTTTIQPITTTQATHTTPPRTTFKRKTTTVPQTSTTIPSTLTTTPQSTTTTTQPTTTTTSIKLSSTASTPMPTTKMTTPLPTITTISPKPATQTASTSTASPTTPTTITSPITTPTTPKSTTTPTTPKPTTTPTTPKPTTKTTTPMTTMLTTLSFTTAPPYTCPMNVVQQSHPGYVFTNGPLCYEYVQRSDTWYTARTDCQNKGGHLVSITDQATQNYIYNLIHSVHDFNTLWIGLYDQENEETWKWHADDSVATYTNWMESRYVDVYHDQEDCGLFVYHRHGQWDDIMCDGQMHPWICQYDAVRHVAG